MLLTDLFDGLVFGFLRLGFLLKDRFLLESFLRLEKYPLTDFASKLAMSLANCIVEGVRKSVIMFVWLFTGYGLVLKGLGASLFASVLLSTSAI